MTIQKILTDSGSQFTDRFTNEGQFHSGQHLFDHVCTESGIEHRLALSKPQTNGVFERFNGRISELMAQTRFASAAELQTTLKHYLLTDNNRIPQWALNLITLSSTQSLATKKPQLFDEHLYEQTGLDTKRFRCAARFIWCRKGQNEMTALGKPDEASPLERCVRRRIAARLPPRSIAASLLR